MANRKGVRTLGKIEKGRKRSARRKKNPRLSKLREDSTGRTQGENSA